jgi:putative membrane protein
MRRGPRLGTPEEFQFEKIEPPPPPAPPALLPAPPLPRRAARLGRWFVGALGALLVGLLALDAVDFLTAQFERSWALGAVFSALIAAVVVTAAALILREASAYRRLRHVEHARARLLAPEAGPAHIIEALEEGFGRTAAFASFRAGLHGGHGPEHLLLLFAEQVLRPLDRDAYQAVGRAARDVAVVTAVAPTALLDTAIMLWRTLRMVRRVAEIYGHRAGLVGTWYLLRRIVTGAAVVAATDVAGNLLAQQLGGALAEVVAAKLGEGAVAATRVSRIGLYTMQLCRVLPFDAADAPTMRRLLETVLTTPPERK